MKQIYIFYSYSINNNIKRIRNLSKTMNIIIMSLQHKKMYKIDMKLTIYQDKIANIITI